MISVSLVFLIESTRLASHVYILLCCFFFVFFVLVTFVLQLRGIVRALLGIPGSTGDDCLHSFFCSPCAITQMVTPRIKQSRLLNETSVHTPECTAKLFLPLLIYLQTIHNLAYPWLIFSGRLFVGGTAGSPGLLVQ